MWDTSLRPTMLGFGAYSTMCGSLRSACSNQQPDEARKAFLVACEMHRHRKLIEAEIPTRWKLLLALRYALRG